MARKTHDVSVAGLPGEPEVSPRPDLGTEIERLHQRLTRLHEEADVLLGRTKGIPPPESRVIEESFEELSTALEELHVADEELGVQQEELVLAHLAAEEARQRYQDLFEFAPDGYLVTDASGGIQEANRAAEALLGVSVALLHRKPLVVFMVKEDRMAYQACLSRARAGEPVAELEVHLQPKGRPPFPAALTLGVARGPSGAANGLRILLRDVTVRRQAEEARRRSEERFARMFRAAPIAITVATLHEGLLLDVNEQFCRLTGYAREALLGRTAVSHRILTPDSRARLVAAAEAGDTAPQELRLRTASGDSCEMLVAAELIELDAFENRACLLAMYVDLSARRRLEREVLEATERERRRFARDLHDGLGSHFTGVAMLARVLADAVRTGEVASPEAIEEIARLVQDGVEEARSLARGLSPVELEGQGLAAALRQLAAATAHRTGIACAFEGDEPPPGVAIEVVSHLYRIGQEAVHNAVRHARARHITIRLRVEPAPEAGVLLLVVEDDGVGLPPEVQSEGMGLDTMRYRAGLIGSTLDVGGIPGRGTRVVCRLPLAAVSDASHREP